MQPLPFSSIVNTFIDTVDCPDGHYCIPVDQFDTESLDVCPAPEDGFPLTDFCVFPEGSSIKQLAVRTFKLGQDCGRLIVPFSGIASRYCPLITMGDPIKSFNQTFVITQAPPLPTAADCLTYLTKKAISYVGDFLDSTGGKTVLVGLGVLGLFALGSAIESRKPKAKTEQ